MKCPKCGETWETEVTEEYGAAYPEEEECPSCGTIGDFV
jgi:uncharacterized Zn finger protein